MFRKFEDASIFSNLVNFFIKKKCGLAARLWLKGSRATCAVEELAVAFLAT